MFYYKLIRNFLMNIILNKKNYKIIYNIIEKFKKIIYKII